MKQDSIIEDWSIFRCKFVQREQDVRQPHNFNVRSGGAFVGFDQVPHCAFHNPTTQNDRKVRRCIFRLRHDFDSPTRLMTFQLFIQFVIMILRIGPNQLQTNILFLRNFSQHQRGYVVVIDVSARDGNRNYKTHYIRKNMALSNFDPFSGIIPRSPPASVGKSILPALSVSSRLSATQASC